MTILDEFDAAAPSYKEFTDKLHGFVEELLRVNNIIVNIIPCGKNTIELGTEILR
jgi:hypothetical protein